MTTVTLADTGTPKRNLIEAAFEECGSAGYEFERTPEEVTSALRKLNMLMKEWPWNLLGYIQPDYGVGSAEDLSNIPGEYEQAVSITLAMRIAPSGGFTLSPESRAALAQSRALLMAQTATIDSGKLGYIAAGAGNRGRVTFISES